MEVKEIPDGLFGMKRVVLTNEFKEDSDVLLACEDALKFLSTMPDEAVRLVITSPPYNIGKSYEERRELNEYLEWQFEVIRECYRVLKPGGSLCWQVGNYVEKGEVFPLDAFFYHLIKRLPEFKLRNRIIWHFEHGLHARTRFSGRYETILWFTKGDSYLFNIDDVRVPQKYPGKRHYKGPKKGLPSSNPLGKNPGDLWSILKEDWENLIWDIPNVKANHPEKTLHPAQFPIELAERLVLALSAEGDTVLDPFMGVGTTVIAALLHRRRGIGVDKEQAYVAIAYQRVQQALMGTLRRRPMGKPKYEPTGKEKTTQKPPEWSQ